MDPRCCIRNGDYFVCCHFRGKYAGILRVEVHDEVQCGLCSIPYVRVLECGQVGVPKGGDQLVFEGSFNHPALVIDSEILLVLSEEALLLPRRHPLWDGFRYSRVGRAHEGGVLGLGIFIGRKDNIEVPVIPSAEGAIYRRRVIFQELVKFLDHCVIRIYRVLG